MSEVNMIDPGEVGNRVVDMGRLESKARARVWAGIGLSAIGLAASAYSCAGVFGAIDARYLIVPCGTLAATAISILWSCLSYRRLDIVASEKETFEQNAQSCQVVHAIKIEEAVIRHAKVVSQRPVLN